MHHNRFPELGDFDTVDYNVETIGYGDQAIRTTAQRMKQIILVSSRNPYIRKWAQKILADVRVNSKRAEAQAIFDFVRDNVRYTKDPHGWEYIQTPPILLEDIKLYMQGKGDRPLADCDDMTVLSLSLAKSVGFPAAIKVVSLDPVNTRFGHVYGQVSIDGQWVNYDTVRPDKWMGWEAGPITRYFELEV